MALSKESWFAPLIMVYVLARTISLMVLQSMTTKGALTDLLFIPIPVIISLFPIMAIEGLSFQMPANCRSRFVGVLAVINICLIFSVDYICCFVVHDAQNGLAIFGLPFVLLGANCFVFVICITWCKLREVFKDKRQW
ncbi:MAG: hypothetical protein WC328_01540 [Kiritimatiellia bacterium]|nr:hypothetical protein [Kiritimatiellia bacterium]MDD4172794.1 hypothetical protein [Kiritimatiellia bacterium]MDD4442253.1 hypothetical protein [Kiritimatiellia bacterium]MDX9792046.1 hypothetical protein [Kiritimatiellia bacterium]